MFVSHAMMWRYTDRGVVVQRLHIMMLVISIAHLLQNPPHSRNYWACRVTSPCFPGLSTGQRRLAWSPGRFNPDTHSVGRLDEIQITPGHQEKTQISSLCRKFCPSHSLITASTDLCRHHSRVYEFIFGFVRQQNSICALQKLYLVFLAFISRSTSVPTGT